MSENKFPTGRLPITTKVCFISYEKFWDNLVNPCLLELERNRIDYHIGTVYTGCQTYVKDLALLSDNVPELQLMTDVVNRHAKQDRVTIHPEKSNAVVLSNSYLFKRGSFSLHLDGESIPLVPNTIHSGILRAETNENVANID